MRRANSVRIIKVPFSDNTSMNVVHEALQGFVSEVDYSPKVTPVS